VAVTGDSVHCNASDGSLLGQILIPESVANVCFGGRKLNRYSSARRRRCIRYSEHARGAARLISGRRDAQRAEPMAMNGVYARSAIACSIDGLRADAIEFGTPWRLLPGGAAAARHRVTDHRT
jgi:hypothetical protein